MPRPRCAPRWRRPLIIDGRNLLDPADGARAGFAYEGIGRPSSPFEALPETSPSPRAAGQQLVEAIILAGGKASGWATLRGGRPKALVPVAGQPLAEYQVAPARPGGRRRA